MTSSRSPHADLDLEGRWTKACKIERILQRRISSLQMRSCLLRVGTGSGAIAHFFAKRSALSCEVHAVDVVDQRQITQGYRLQRVRDQFLPYEDGKFDAVISNHVIEHVGDGQAQYEHLAELYRVLKPGGVGYIAMPNRWQDVEPHFRLPFLSWMPPGWRSAYVRLAGRGRAYDCRPLRLPELENLLRKATFKFENVGVEALRKTLLIERARSWVSLIFGWIPDRILLALRRINSTHDYVVCRTVDPCDGVADA